MTGPRWTAPTEGLLRSLASDRFEVQSAGTDAGPAVNPRAIEVMAEIGIDISGQQPKPVRPFLGHPLHYVITVCDPANQRCPIFPGVTKRLRWTFSDPGKTEGSHEARLAMFRQVREDIGAQIRRFLAETA